MATAAHRFATHSRSLPTVYYLPSLLEFAVAAVAKRDRVDQLNVPASNAARASIHVISLKSAQLLYWRHWATKRVCVMKSKSQVPLGPNSD